MRILMYHTVGQEGDRFAVSPAAWESQAAWLASGQTPCLTLREAAGAADRRAVVLTFDDGTRDTYETAWPILRRHGLTATVFLVTDYMGQVAPWPGTAARLMDWGQAREMSREGVEIGSHTATHLDLRQAEVGVLREELRRSKAAIEEQIGTEVVSFAYPFGYFRACLPELLAEAGYKWAVLGGTYGYNTSATRPFELRRIRVAGDVSLRAWRRNLGPVGAWRYYTEKVRQEFLWQWRRAGAEQPHGR
jgi:peptidoglycan/xylan/chitin deacetylase (PgdA/CDA1 family)